MNVLHQCIRATSPTILVQLQVNLTDHTGSTMINLEVFKLPLGFIKCVEFVSHSCSFRLSRSDLRRHRVLGRRALRAGGALCEYGGEVSNGRDVVWLSVRVSCFSLLFPSLAVSTKRILPSTARRTPVTYR